MHVVTAGVHHAGVPRRERDRGLLRDGQRIDVAAERDGRGAGARAGDARDEAGVGDLAHIGDARVEERLLERRLGPAFGPRELGMRVQRAAEREEPLAFRVGEERRRGGRTLGVGRAHARSSSVRTVMRSMCARSTSMPIPGWSSGTFTIPCASIVHSGATTSLAQ